MFAWEQTEQVNEIEEAARRLTQIDAQMESLKSERNLLLEQISKEFSAAIPEETKTFGRFVVTKTTPQRRSWDEDKVAEIVKSGPALPPCVEYTFKVNTRAWNALPEDDKKLLAPALIVSPMTPKFEIAEITTTTEDEHAAPTA